MRDIYELNSLYVRNKTLMQEIISIKNITSFKLTNLAHLGYAWKITFTKK